ncbi:MAG: recombinase family protein [Bdellovibrionales bacterium]|nr:recombinase family protein [Bdellovibrionales bacterium]
MDKTKLDRQMKKFENYLTVDRGLCKVTAIGYCKAASISLRRMKKFVPKYCHIKEHSSDMQSDCSADDQIARIKYRVKSGQLRSITHAGKPFQIAPEWILKDEAQSGRVAGRAGYEKVINGIRNKAFDILVVDDLSRLTRSLGNLLGLYDMLKWYEVELISICDGISSEDPSAKTFFTVKGMVNDFSNDIHAERVIRGLETRALKGLSCGDYPYGYDSAPTKFENAKGRPFPSHYKISVNKLEAQTVRRIFAMYDLGLGYTRIAKVLNEEKTPSPSAYLKKAGKTPSWSPRGVQHILQNSKYVGIWKWKKTKLGLHPETRRRTSKERPITDWVTHLEGKEVREDLRIVDQAAWEQVQLKFEENKKIPRDLRNNGRWYDRKKILPDHPFSGLMVCNICSTNFTLISGRRGGYYGCSDAHLRGTCSNKQMIQIDRVESSLVDTIADKLGQNEILKYAAEKYNKVLQEKLSVAPERLKKIDVEIERTEEELTKLLDFIVSGNSSDTINTAIKDREERKVKLLSEARALKSAQIKIKQVNSVDIRDRLDNLCLALKSKPQEAYPAIRTLFPDPIQMHPKGKCLHGTSLYEMRGRIVLNGILDKNFEISVKKETEEGADALSSGNARSLPRPCVSKGLGFGAHENGVIDGA